MSIELELFRPDKNAPTFNTRFVINYKRNGENEKIRR